MNLGVLKKNPIKFGYVPKNGTRQCAVVVKKIYCSLKTSVENTYKKDIKPQINFVTIFLLTCMKCSEAGFI